MIITQLQLYKEFTQTHHPKYVCYNVDICIMSPPPVYRPLYLGAPAIWVPHDL